MRNVTIVESNVEPNKEHLWFYNGKLKWFGPNGWEEINPQVLSPTTTTSTPLPTTTTTSTPSPGTTTTTTTTSTPMFKLINNTGDTLEIGGYGFVEGGIGTSIPPVPNGGSIFLVKISEQEFIMLHSVSNYKLGIIIDGEDKGELSSDSTYYTIPRSIFIDATEISVYRVGS